MLGYPNTLLWCRDGMWVTERGSSGATTLIPFADFKDVRYDKDLRKSYLQGRMGGVPRILRPSQENLFEID
jgi:uncharacterized protein